MNLNVNGHVVEGTIFVYGIASETNVRRFFRISNNINGIYIRTISTVMKDALR